MIAEPSYLDGERLSVSGDHRSARRAVMAISIDAPSLEENLI
jgi:hypothetical protein